MNYERNQQKKQELWKRKKTLRKSVEQRPIMTMGTWISRHRRRGNPRRKSSRNLRRGSSTKPRRRTSRSSAPTCHAMQTRQTHRYNWRINLKTSSRASGVRTPRKSPSRRTKFCGMITGCWCGTPRRKRPSRSLSRFPWKKERTTNRKQLTKPVKYSNVLLSTSSF